MTAKERKQRNQAQSKAFKTKGGRSRYCFGARIEDLPKMGVWATPRSTYVHNGRRHFQ